LEYISADVLHASVPLLGSHMTDHLSRRRFLKQTASGMLALTAADMLPRSETAVKIPSDIASQLRYFSPHEYVVIESVAERIVGQPVHGGPTASQVGVALRADKFLSSADPEIKDQFHQLLTVFNAPIFTFLFDFRFSSFINMRPEDQDSYLEDWMTSNLAFRRTGFQALKRTCLSMFYTEPLSWKEIGFEGMGNPLPQ
jgi:hypothetical protein